MGVDLGSLSWQQAEPLLNSDSVVVIPLGAEAKEHGPHLQLKNDFIVAEYLKHELLKTENVLVAPTINYSFYPAFVTYPGSVSLKLETARDVIVDICESYARFGVRKFYVINFGISTLKPLRLATEILKKKNLLLHFTDLNAVLKSTEQKIAKQEGGSHADEMETSLMLAIAPQTVNMKLAAKDFNQGEGPLTRDPNDKKGTYSPTGIWGDATLATPEKGRIISTALLDGIRNDLNNLKASK